MIDLEQWKDIPATFRHTVEETLETKNDKNWSYLVNTADETVFLAFINKFEAILPDARVHIVDGYYQDKTYSMLFENGSKVIYFIFSFKLRTCFPNTVTETVRLNIDGNPKWISQLKNPLNIFDFLLRYSRKVLFCCMMIGELLSRFELL